MELLLTCCCYFCCCFCCMYLLRSHRGALRAPVSIKRLPLGFSQGALRFYGIVIHVGPSSRRLFQGFPRSSKKILQGAPEASQGVPKASPDVHPRRARDLPRHPQGLPKRSHGETYNFIKIVLPSRRNTKFSGLARYMLTPSWPRATMLAGVGPKLTPRY